MNNPLARLRRRAIGGLRLAVREPPAGWLMVRMLAWRAALPVLKRVLPLPTLVRLTAAGSDHRGERNGAELVVELAGRIFDSRSSAHTCLDRSMVTYRYLSKAGVDPHLVIAFRKGAAPVLGHAWVTVEGRPMHDSPSALDAFQPLLTFGSAGQCLELI